MSKNRWEVTVVRGIAIVNPTPVMEIHKPAGMSQKEFERVMTVVECEVNAALELEALRTKHTTEK